MMLRKEKSQREVAGASKRRCENEETQVERERDRERGLSLLRVRRSSNISELKVF